MFDNGYPTYRFSWNDRSGASTDTSFSATDGLCVPFAFVMAERGDPGAIYFGGSAELTPKLGAATFDPTQPYFNTSSLFVGTAMAGQGVEVMRLVDPAATIASLGLFVSVTPKAVTQFKKTASGARILDKNGNYIPQLQADGVTPVTQPGIEVKWSIREIDADEAFNALSPVTTNVGNVTTTTYPVVALQMTSPGKYGNRQGFSFYSTTTKDSSVSQSIDSILYRFVPMELPTTVSTTAGALLDVYSSQYNDVSFKNSAIYGGTNTNYNIDYVFSNNYVDADSGDNVLPYTMFTYGGNIGAVGEAALAVSPELVGLDPYMIDLMSCADLNGNLYDHIQLDVTSATVVNSSVINYAQGGSDGDTSWSMFEQLVGNWLAGSDHGEFPNLQQHPMTHFYDPGFSLPTKTLLLNMLDLRDNFKIDLATQDISLPVNTKAEDISVGQTLLFRAQMHPESVINGVGCTRVGIYAHASTLASGAANGVVIPFNYNRMIQRRNLDGGTYIKGSSGGRPGSDVTQFRKPNWVADNESDQSLAWANCINVVRHATRTAIFYPSLRTVYPNDTSLLSDDEVSDRILYIFKIVREVWAEFVGTRKEVAKLFPQIQKEINDRCAAALAGDNVKVKSTVFQTAADSNLGYQTSVNLAVTGTMPLRTMNFNVIVARE
jgi:hypothetical protein